mgnify:FL=1
MNKSAILHIPMSQYAYGIDENHVTIRIRTGKDDIKKCILYFGDRACRQTPVIFTKVCMQIVASSELFDYYEVTLENPYKRICYYFELDDGIEKLLYYGDVFCEHPVDDRSEYYQLPFNHRADIVRPPEWVKKAVIYNIFPDSFASSKNFISGRGSVKEYNGIKVNGKLGGTICGITDNVSYLRNLGVNAIYINPIFTAGEYHKYDLIDYFHIDPCFGTDEDFLKLVDVFHKNGIRVIIDGVFNHCGWKFFAFEDVVKNGEKSKYRDWFYGLQFPVVRPSNGEDYPNYECFGYERLMPKLNTANKEVQDYFCNVGTYWIEKFHIDGWRLDVASEINDKFWMAFRDAVKKANSEAVLIGEIWESAGHWLDGKMFDSAMNYDFRKHCRRFFAEESIDAAEFDSRVTDMRMRYRTQTVFSQLNVLDSHDVSRFLSLCGENREKYKLAIVFQMCFPGMPSVFYGDELGVTGISEDEYRQKMPWGKKDELQKFFEKMIGLRLTHKALTEGSYHTLTAEKTGRMYGFERSYEKEHIRIYLNMGEKKILQAETIGQTILYSEKYENDELLQYGFVIAKSSD